jgi:hypothetical protein
MPNHLRRQRPREQRSCNTDTNYYGDRVCAWAPEDPKVAREPFKANSAPASSSCAESSDAVEVDLAGTSD